MPAILNISGGRTSGLMLRRVLDAHGGHLPADVIPVFCNTGREFPQTLDFLREMERRWACSIVWLEWQKPSRRERRPCFRVVTHETASRDGRPFAELIASKRCLPDAAKRFCTEHLKVLPTAAFARRMGWRTWDSYVGLRADEPDRVHRVRVRAQEKDSPWTPIAPLHRDGITKADVMAFWASQPFDLQLHPWESNCDLCFMKSFPVKARLILDHPGIEAWWAEQEDTVSRGRRRAMFRHGFPVQRFADGVRAQVRLPILDDDQPAMPCACTD